MADPTLDVSGLIPSIDDRDPQTMFEEWISRVQLEIPDYQPTNGSLDVIIAESLVTACADVIYAVNRLPGVVLQAVLALMDIERSPGVHAEGDIELLLDGPRSAIVQRGARFEIEGREFVATGSSGATGDRIAVHVAAVDVGGGPNLIQPGAAVDMLDPMPGVVGGHTVGAFTGGVEPEDDTAYLARAATWLQRMTSALVLPSSFAAFADGQPDVARSHTEDLHEPGNAVQAPGHMTLYVLGRGGPLSAARLTALHDDLASRASAHLTVHVANATVVDVPVTLSVHAQGGQDPAALGASVEAELRAAISPESWSWGAEVVPQEVNAIASRVAGVDYVQAVTAPAAAVPMPAGSLPRAEPVTVTVV